MLWNPPNRGSLPEFGVFTALVLKGGEVRYLPWPKKARPSTGPKGTIIQTLHRTPKIDTAGKDSVFANSLTSVPRGPQFPGTSSTSHTIDSWGGGGR